MAVAITDIAGNLVYFEKIDDTQTASVKIAIGKSRSAALFKRPTKCSGYSGWRQRLHSGLEGAVPS